MELNAGQIIYLKYDWIKAIKLDHNAILCQGLYSNIQLLARDGEDLHTFYLPTGAFGEGYRAQYYYPSPKAEGYKETRFDGTLYQYDIMYHGIPYCAIEPADFPETGKFFIMRADYFWDSHSDLRKNGYDSAQTQVMHAARVTTLEFREVVRRDIIGTEFPSSEFPFVFEESISKHSKALDEKEKLILTREQLFNVITGNSSLELYLTLGNYPIILDHSHFNL